MVLEPDITRKRVIPVSDVELVSSAIGAAVGFGEFYKINHIHRLAIQLDLDLCVARVDFDAIPFSNRTHGVASRLRKIIKRASIVITRGQGIVDRDFKPVESNVLTGVRCEGRSPEKDAAITERRDLEIKFEDEIPPGSLVN